MKTIHSGKIGRHKTHTKKPHLRIQSVQRLQDLHDYIERYDCKGRALLESASDVLDGACSLEEINPLLETGLLKIQSDPGARLNQLHDTDTVGQCRWTVILTPKACRLFWPERL